MRSIPAQTRLDHVTVARAVADYMTIIASGAEAQLRHELAAAYRTAEAYRLRRPIGAEFQAATIARGLAHTLDLPEAELLPAARAYLMGDDRVAVALAVLHEMAERLRRERKGVA